MPTLRHESSGAAPLAEIEVRQYAAHAVAEVVVPGPAAEAGADLAWEGAPVRSRHDAPFTPWFMRRNEIWLGLTAPL